MNIMKLIDIFNSQINETPEAGFGDMNDDMVTHITQQPVLNLRNYIDRGSFEVLNHTVHLYQIPNSYKHVFGIIEKEKFHELGNIILTPIANIMRYNNVYTIDEIEVANDVRGNGLSTKLYSFLVLNLHMVLMCGNIQFFGARKLWSRLSKHPDIAIDVIDMCTQKIIEKNIVLNHGPDNDDFDTKYWGVYRGDTDYKCFRFIMRPK